MNVVLQLKHFQEIVTEIQEEPTDSMKIQYLANELAKARTIIEEAKQSCQRQCGCSTRDILVLKENK